VYIIDFGLASTMRQESVSRLTPDDTLVGTLAYISPEQTGRMNRQVDYRTDLYSLGVILYELFTGQLPFESSDALEMIHAHIARQPQPPHQINAGIPSQVSGIILKLLAKNAEDRYQTAYGLQADLKIYLDEWQSRCACAVRCYQLTVGRLAPHSGVQDVAESIAEQVGA
jgi:serine/threonine protein kinase